MRSVLFITYQFPPAAGPGVQRSLKFIKYLPEFGWQSIVITAKPAKYGIKDYSLCDDVPEKTPVFRSFSIDVNRLRPVFDKIYLGFVVTFINLLFQLPDMAIFWQFLVRSKVKQAIRTYRPEAVFSSSGPGSAHLLAKWIKKQYGLPWIADFRDLWYRNRAMPYFPGYRLLNKLIEQNVLKHADMVTTVSQSLLDSFRDNCKSNQVKFLLLPNGYDPADIQGNTPLHRDKIFTISHIGSLYRYTKPEVFVKTIDYLISRGIISINQIKIIFAGRRIPNSVPRKAPFEVREYLPHNTLRSLREQSDAFLLLLDTDPQSSGNLSGKVFEYMAANRPILAIVPPKGAAFRLLNETRTGVVLQGSIETMALTIENLITRMRINSDFWRPDQKKIQAYSRKKLTEKLAYMLDNLTSENKSR